MLQLICKLLQNVTAIVRNISKYRSYCATIVQNISKCYSFCAKYFNYVVRYSYCLNIVCNTGVHIRNILKIKKHFLVDKENIPALLQNNKTNAVHLLEILKILCKNIATISAIANIPAVVQI